MIYVRLFLPAILSVIVIVMAAVRYETRKMQWALTYFVGTGIYVLTYKPLGPLNAFNLTFIGAAVTFVFLHFYLENREKEKAEASDKEPEPDNRYHYFQEKAKREADRKRRLEALGSDLKSEDERPDEEDEFFDTEGDIEEDESSPADEDRWIGYDK